MKKIGNILNVLTILAVMFGLFGYGSLLMLSLFIAFAYRPVDTHDVLLYYEGLVFVMASVSMFAAAVDSTFETVEEVEPYAFT